MEQDDRRHLGRVFDEVPELYDRVRPTYPDQLFGDPVAMTGFDERSTVLEVGCGTGQATRSLAALGCRSPPSSPAPAWQRSRASACQLLERCGRDIIVRAVERPRPVLVAASSWHWVDPSIGWRRARDVLHPGGWMALLGKRAPNRTDQRFPGHPTTTGKPHQNRVAAQR